MLKSAQKQVDKSDEAKSKKSYGLRSVRSRKLGGQQAALLERLDGMTMTHEALIDDLRAKLGELTEKHGESWDLCTLSRGNLNQILNEYQLEDGFVGTRKFNILLQGKIGKLESFAKDVGYVNDRLQAQIDDLALASSDQ